MLMHCFDQYWCKKRFILWQDLFLFKPYRRAAIVQGKLNILLDKNGFCIKYLKIIIKIININFKRVGMQNAWLITGRRRP